METAKAARYIDHTLLKQSATRTEIAKLCAEAMEFNFYSVCVNPFWIPLCRRVLANSKVKVCTVVGFPLGANLTKTKIEETAHALAEGAQEIDCVINVGALKSGNLPVVGDELEGIISQCRGRALVKVIVESGLLTQEQLIAVIQVVNESGAEFIKTSTGFASTGATPEAVQLMRKFGRPDLQIKASGGIRNAEDFQNYVALGATRIGASRSVEILKELEKM